MGSIPTRLRLTAEDKQAVAAYWTFYEPLAAQINAELRDSLLKLPEWAAVVRAMSPREIAARDERTRELERQAMRDGDWAPYLEDIREQGVRYANMGISFIACFDVIAIYRELIRRRLIELAERDAARERLVADGMNRAIDIAIAHLGEAYLLAKEQIIAQQQAAIRELSIPVLQVRDGLLVLPVIGVVDASRARQLIETLLGSIRDRRARGVVLDVTGVPHVDTAVASYLVQACDAARLMGATVAITGISPEMAVTLVGLGARLPTELTLGDLQEGIEQIERWLADPSRRALQVGNDFA